MDNMEKLTGQVMANETASAIYASLDSHIHPATLADDYLAAKLADNGALCLALELYIRQAAQIHFHRPEVLQALQDIEKHKTRRKMGANGAGHLKRIARKIREKYPAGDFERLPGVAGSPDRVKFSIACAGSILTVICTDKPGAVALVAAKYDRGWRQPSWRRA